MRFVVKEIRKEKVVNTLTDNARKVDIIGNFLRMTFLG